MAISTIHCLLTPSIVQRGRGSKLDSSFYGKITMSQTFWPGLKTFKITSETFLQDPKSAHNTCDHFTRQSENNVYCISCRRCNCLYIGETGRRLRELFSEHLRGIRNQSRGYLVAEHFNSASHSSDDIMVFGLKQCSGRNINRKQHELKLTFTLGTLRPNRLSIDFNFL